MGKTVSVVDTIGELSSGGPILHPFYKKAIMTHQLNTASSNFTKEFEKEVSCAIETIVQDAFARMKSITDQWFLPFPKVLFLVFLL